MTAWLVSLWFSSSILFPVSNSIYNVIFFNIYDTSIWFLPLPTSFPYDVNTYIGYALHVITESYIGHSYIITMCGMVTFFISCCLHIGAVIMSWKESVASIDGYIRKTKNPSALQLTGMYHETVSSHIKIYEYVFLQLIYYKKCIQN